MVSTYPHRLFASHFIVDDDDAVHHLCIDNELNRLLTIGNVDLELDPLFPVFG
jgi:hypothetical protein